MILRITRSFPFVAAGFAGLAALACSSTSSDTGEPLGGAGDSASGSGGNATTSTGAGGDSQGTSGNTGTAGSTTGTAGATAMTGAGGSAGGAAGSAGGGKGGAAGSTPVGDAGSGSFADCTYTLPAGAALCSCPSITGRANCTATKAQPILDDGEWQDDNDGQGLRPEGANLGSFGGWWGHWSDSGSSGCVQTIPMPPSNQNWPKQYANPLIPQPNPFDAKSKAAMSLKGAGCTGTTAFWVGAGPDPACDNLSAFQGFTFSAIADGNVDITAFVTLKDDPSQSSHAVVFHASNAWQKFDVPFCALSNASTFNAANVAEVGFSVTAAAFQMWIDDIVFQ